MADPQKNKETVLAYYNMAFNDKKPAEAAQKYGGPHYIQHNPQAPDGFEAFVEFVEGFAEQFPQMSVDIKRAVAEGDLVVTHSLLKTSPEDRGTAAADIFRLEDGKVVEHWDVVQPVPESAANDNPCSDSGMQEGSTFLHPALVSISARFGLKASACQHAARLRRAACQPVSIGASTLASETPT